MLFDKDSMIKRHMNINADLNVFTVSESGLLTLNAKTVGTDQPTTLADSRGGARQQILFFVVDYFSIF